MLHRHVAPGTTIPFCPLGLCLYCVCKDSTGPQLVHKSTVQQRNWKFDLLAMFHVIVHKLLICETGIINQCKSLVSFSAVSTSEYMVYIPYQ